jgi:hypothetical protein
MKNKRVGQYLYNNERKIDCILLLATFYQNIFQNKDKN